MADTIFALSSGSPPAAIAVIRIAGPLAGRALERLAGELTPARRAVFRILTDERGGVLDHALVLWLPGPANAIGEDTAELHCHGGRAVVRAIERALALIDGLRAAEPGEFTRRAFANGRLDLTEAEGLADLLEAETEWQRRAALAATGGAISAKVENWRRIVLALAAEVESVLDFGDEDDVGPSLADDFAERVASLRDAISTELVRPGAERLREGYRVAIAGPPNAGKSTLFNALLEQEAAIATPIAGTTRDVLERSLSWEGIPFTLIDMAGLRPETSDPIEAEGIGRAEAAIDTADCVLWLGEEGAGPDGSVEIEARIDDTSAVSKVEPALRLSARTGEGMDTLRHWLVAHARVSLPRPGEAAWNARQRSALAEAADALREEGVDNGDELLIAENLRRARQAFDRLTGRAATEDVLDTLFARFCIGK